MGFPVPSPIRQGRPCLWGGRAHTDLEATLALGRRRRCFLTSGCPTWLIRSRLPGVGGRRWGCGTQKGRLRQAWAQHPGAGSPLLRGSEASGPAILTHSRERLPCPSIVLSVSFLGHVHTTELPSHMLTAASVHPFPNLPMWIFRGGGQTP